MTPVFSLKPAVVAVLGYSVLLCSSQSQAEQTSTDDDADNNLEEVVAYGSSYRATGTKTTLTPMQSPMSYEVYDRELLDSRQADSVSQALRYVTGVTPESRATVSVFDQYNIRGFESYYNYYDGLPLQTNGSWNLAPQVDAFATDAVEVLKGPTSVLYGSAPPGGMINQIARTPQQQPQHQLRGRLGSNGLRELALNSSSAISTDLAYRLIALKRSQDGQQQTTEEERTVLAPSVTWWATPDTEITVSLYHQQDPKLTPSTPLPYQINGRTPRANAYAGDSNWSGVDREITLVGYKISHQLTDTISLLQNFRHSSGNLLQKNTYNGGFVSGSESEMLRSAYQTDEAMQGFVIDNQLGWYLDAGASQHNLLVGIDYNRLTSSALYNDTLYLDTPTIDLANPDYNQIDPNSLPLDNYEEDHRIQQSQVGVYLQDEIRFDQLTLLAGLRWDKYFARDRADNLYMGSGYSSDSRISQTNLSKRLAAMYQFNSEMGGYLNYSESFEPTAGADSATGEAFKPTTARQWESGLKFQSADLLSSATLAVYDLRKQNVVVNSADYTQKTQTGEISSRGVELTLNHWLTDSLAIDANASWQDVEITDNELYPQLQGNSPVWVADTLASVWLDYHASDALIISGGVRHVGESQLDAANSDTVPGYTLVDLAASWQAHEQVKTGLSVSNLANKQYVGACYDASNCWMGAERAIEASATVSF
ncbi:TonB-dependent siderophore receptor [Oceanobacter mangrovi]|uniref:TonB-dependent siderophore receptor n=1 Tax=Oceanobacter mangrovi TaxID=2862510 RepID=UPI001C8D6E32|nr:TonB-dependent siderophore receptor [Oceanobacter mangrovi]